MRGVNRRTNQALGPGLRDRPARSECRVQCWRRNRAYADPTFAALARIWLARKVRTCAAMPSPTILGTSYYRRVIPELLAALEFRSSNTRHAPVIDALVLMRRYAHRSSVRHFAADDKVPLDGIVPADWRAAVVEDLGPSETAGDHQRGHDQGPRAVRRRFRCALERALQPTPTLGDRSDHPEALQGPLPVASRFPGRARHSRRGPLGSCRHRGPGMRFRCRSRSAADNRRSAPRGQSSARHAAGAAPSAPRCRRAVPTRSPAPTIVTIVSAPHSLSSSINCRARPTSLVRSNGTLFGTASYYRGRPDWATSAGRGRRIR
jgi:hypothetical protein